MHEAAPSTAASVAPCVSMRQLHLQPATSVALWDTCIQKEPIMKLLHASAKDILLWTGKCRHSMQ